MSDSSTRFEATVLQLLATLGTLHAATQVWHRIDERRAGRDPSTQEADTLVRPWLISTVQDDLQPLLMRLQASLITRQTAPPSKEVQVVQWADDLMALRQATDLLQVVHQRLLSVYPDVPEALVERARVVYTEAGILLEGEVDAEALQAWVDRALRLVHGVEAALGGTSS